MEVQSEVFSLTEWFIAIKAANMIFLLLSKFIIGLP
jgi:hypothetical protein